MGVADVDERGRIVIPREVREELGIRPGSQVRLERTEEGLLLRPQRPMREALARLKAALPRRRTGPREDPRRLKELWTADLPKRYR